MNIIPAILEKTLDDFTRTLEDLLPLASHLHIDIANGTLVDNSTLSLPEILECLAKNTNSQRKTFEFHLMVDDFQDHLDLLSKSTDQVTVGRVYVHAGVAGTSVVSRPHFPVGLILSPEDTITEHYELIRRYDAVQIMTINPGSQGNRFLPETLSTLEALDDLGYAGHISLDGSINDQTLPQVLLSRRLPDSIVVGSYLKENKQKGMEALKKILETSST